jgi:hypothetical protein
LTEKKIVINSYNNYNKIKNDERNNGNKKVEGIIENKNEINKKFYENDASFDVNLEKIDNLMNNNIINSINRKKNKKQNKIIL